MDQDIQNIDIHAMPILAIEDIARVAHNVNTTYAYQTDGLGIYLDWEHTSDDQRQSMIRGVEAKLRYDLTPEQQHQAWAEDKTKNGWTYGSIKDTEAKTHPCLVDYEFLPLDQRLKDHLFDAVVSSLKRYLPRLSEDQGQVMIWDTELFWVETDFSKLKAGNIFFHPKSDPRWYMFAVTDPYPKYSGATVALNIDGRPVYKMKDNVTGTLSWAFDPMAIIPEGTNVIPEPDYIRDDDDENLD